MAHATSYTRQLYLFGPLEARANGLVQPLRRKMRALLAYLAVTGQAHSRHALCDLFFPDTNDPLGALRWQLSQLRRLLGSDALLVDGDRVQFNPQAVWVDCLEFRHALDRPLADLTPRQLQAAVDLYRGEFLAALAVPDAPDFELWLLGRRADFQQRHLRALGQLIALLRDQGQVAQALPYAEKLVLNDPLLEEAHMQLIWLYARTGQRDAAIAQFERCTTILRQELAVEPTSELVALYQEVVQGRPSARWPITHHPPATALPPATLQPIVGRQEELAQLHRQWQRATQGEGGVAMVEAVAGGGKTYLIRHFCDSLGNSTVLVGHCYESTRKLLYSPWLELLEQSMALINPADLAQMPAFWLNQLVHLSPALVALAGDETSLPVPPGEINQDHLAMAIGELIRKLLRRPVIIFVDNLQWADESSLQLFQRLAQRTPRLPVLLVGAVRSEETDANELLQTLLRDLRRGSTSRLKLAPLTLASIAQLVESLWPELPPGYRTHVCRMLAQSTGGNPFFVTEVVRELRRSEAPATVLPIPESVQTLIGERLTRLPPGSRQVLEALAILGSPMMLAILQQTSARSEDETVSAIEIGLRWGILAAQGSDGVIQYDFSHDLVRAAVAGQLSVVRRQLLHRRAAEALETVNTPAAVLTYHWALAGNQEREGHYAALAGEQAAAIYANEEAVRYLERTLRLIHDPARQVSVMCRLGEVLQLLGRRQEAETIYEQALALAESAAHVESARLWAQPAQASCQVALGRLMRLRGDYTQAQIWLERAQTTYQALGNQKGLAQTSGGLGAVYWSLLDRPRALRCFQEQLDIARNLGDRKEMGSAIGSMGVVLAEQGEYAQALECYAQRLQIDLELNDRLSLAATIGNMGIVYAEQGDYMHALACYHSLLQRMLELGHRPNVCIAVGNMIEVYMALHQDSVAERLGQVAIALGRALKLPLYLCEYLHVSAKLLARQGRHWEARTLNDEAVIMAAAIGQADVQLPALLLSVRLRLATGTVETVEAVKDLESFLEEWPEDYHQAAILYELWRHDNRLAHRGQQAAARYRRLYARTPNITYRQRYEEVTGTVLPLPQAVPAPPQVIIGSPVDLDALLVQVDQLLTDLEAG